MLKYKRSVHKYRNEDWVTAETINPNFTGQLKEWKVDAFLLFNTIYKHTETARVQARAATEIYEQLQTIIDNRYQEEDINLFRTTVEQARRLSIYGFESAKQQEHEVKEVTTKALKLPVSHKHMETPASGEKKYAFDQQFVEQYYEEFFKQRITGDAARNNQNRNRFASNGNFRGRGFNGYKGGRPFLS